MGRPSFSLKHFIEQTARILRDAAKIPTDRKDIYSKENGLTNRNKIHQIAFLLRSKTKKQKRRKR